MIEMEGREGMSCTLCTNVPFPFYGEGKAGQWVYEGRNLHKDYKSAFGKDQDGVLAIGIQTDTDHSNEMVTAYYSDPVLRKK
jgi:hypothetical protein